MFSFTREIANGTLGKPCAGPGAGCSSPRAEHPTPAPAALPAVVAEVSCGVAGLGIHTSAGAERGPWPPLLGFVTV
jgi:hypothetical protein